MDMKLEGLRAVIGGGSSGLGLASAKALAAEGVQVCLVARDEVKLRQAVDQIRENGGAAVSIVADLYDVDAIQATVDAIHAALGTPHILLLNNGGPPPAAAAAFDAAQWRREVEGQLLSSIAMANAFVPQMKAQGFGRVVLIASTSVVEPIPGLALSNSLRAGLANWAKTLANELAAFGITVNTLLPGSFDTARTRDLLTRAAIESGRTLAALEAEESLQIPMRRYGAPGELGALVAFLSSPLAGYITGVRIAIDGGLCRTA